MNTLKNEQLREELNEMKAQMALILEKMPNQQSNASASAGLAVELVNRENEKILNMMNISLNDPFIKICAFSSVFETIGRPMVFIATLSKNKTQIVLEQEQIVSTQNFWKTKMFNCFQNIYSPNHLRYKWATRKQQTSPKQFW